MRTVLFSRARLALVASLLVAADAQCCTVSGGVLSCAGCSASTTWLSLEGLGITSLPEGVFANLTALTTLYLTSNSLSSFNATTFLNLTSLTALYLNLNQLTSVPVGIFSGLTALTALDLSNNQLTSLPPGIFSGFSAVTSLDLGLNALASLDADVFADLRSLRGLNLGTNRLTSFPAGLFSNLTSLVNLNINVNQLPILPTEIFSGLTALTVLGMGDNQFTSLPLSLACLPSTLTYIDVGSNPLPPGCAAIFSSPAAINYTCFGLSAPVCCANATLGSFCNSGVTTICPTGSYCAGAGAAPMLCPAGTSSTTGSSSPSDCTLSPSASASLSPFYQSAFASPTLFVCVGDGVVVSSSQVDVTSGATGTSGACWGPQLSTLNSFTATLTLTASVGTPPGADGFGLVVGATAAGRAATDARTSPSAGFVLDDYNFANNPGTIYAAVTSSVATLPTSADIPVARKSSTSSNYGYTLDLTLSYDCAAGTMSFSSTGSNLGSTAVSATGSKSLFYLPSALNGATSGYLGVGGWGGGASYKRTVTGFSYTSGLYCAPYSSFLSWTCLGDAALVSPSQVDVTSGAATGIGACWGPQVSVYNSYEVTLTLTSTVGASLAAGGDFFFAGLSAATPSADMRAGTTSGFVLNDLSPTMRAAMGSLSYNPTANTDTAISTKDGSGNYALSRLTFGYDCVNQMHYFTSSGTGSVSAARNTTVYLPTALVGATTGTLGVGGWCGASAFKRSVSGFSYSIGAFCPPSFSAPVSLSPQPSATRPSFLSSRSRSGSSYASPSPSALRSRSGSPSSRSVMTQTLARTSTATPRWSSSALTSPLPACAAPPGSFCSDGAITPCPVGAYCPGGDAATPISCVPSTACATRGMSAFPACASWDVTTLAGNGSTYCCTFPRTYYDGVGTLATFYSPTGVRVDTSGVVYVVDQSTFVLRKIVSGVVSTVAGWGYYGFANGPNANAQFFATRGVAVSPDATTLYVVETNNYDGYSKVRAVSLTTGQTTTLAGNTIAASTDGVGTAASFRGAHAATVDALGFIYIADTSGHKIRNITPAGLVTTLAGNGSSTPFTDDTTATAATLNTPRGVAVNASRVFIIADSGNNCIRMISPSSVITTLAGSRTPGFADGVGTASSFNAPSDVSLLGEFIYVADYGNQRVRVINADRVVSTLAGTGNAGFGDGTGTTALFAGVFGIAAAPSGVVYVTDQSNARVRQLTCVSQPATSSSQPYLYTITTTLAGSSTAIGASNGQGSSASFGYAGSYAPLGTGYGIAISSNGTVFLTDTGNGAIRVITSTGWVSTLAGGGCSRAGFADGQGASACFNIPIGITISDNGTLFVADSLNHAIRTVTPTGLVRTLAGCSAPRLTDGQGTSACFNTPTGIALSPEGTLFVTDFGNHAVRAITPAGIVTTFAGNNSLIGSSNGVGTSASFSSPFGLAFTSNGTLYVTDMGNCAVRAITPSGVVSTLAGGGGGSACGFVNGQGAAVRFNAPQGINVAPNSTVIVADTGNNLIRVITNGVVSVLAGSTTPGAADGFGTRVRFQGPSGVAFFNSTVFVGDAQNYNIRAIRQMPCFPGSYCPPGTNATFLCPPGTYTSFANASSSADCAVCNVLGYYCAAGSLSATQSACPQGTFGEALGLTNATCSGNCSMGYFCLAGSTSATQYRALPPSPAAGYTYTVKTLISNAMVSTSNFHCPNSIAMSPTSNIYYVLDAYNCNIRALTPSGSMSTFASVSCYPNNIGVAADGKMFVLAGWPSFIVQAVSSSGALSTVASAGFGGQNMAVSPNGTVFFTSGYSNGKFITAVASPGGPSVTLAGGNVGGYADGQGQAALFSGGEPLATMLDGTIILLDSPKIRVISPAGWVSTLAGGRYVLPDGSPTTFSSLSNVAVSSTNVIYVMDGAAIKAVTLGGVVSLIAGKPSGGYNVIADGIGTAASFAGNVPYCNSGLAVSPSGDVIVIADGGNDAVRTITLTLCAVGSYCPNATATVACPLGTSSPAGSSSLSNCTLSPSASASLSPSVFATPSSRSSATTSVSATPSTTMPLPDGSACTSSGGCASGACRKGACCNANAVRAGCAACSLQTGSCLTASPGEACGSPFDCGTNLCLSGCCCAASAVATTGCSACACWGGDTTAASAGGCIAAPPPLSVTGGGGGGRSISSFYESCVITPFPSSSSGFATRDIAFNASGSMLASNASGIYVIPDVGAHALVLTQDGIVDFVLGSGSTLYFIVGHSVQVATAGGNLSLLAGSVSVSGSANGVGGVARFSSPAALTYSTSSNMVYMADAANHMVRAVTAVGSVLTLAGATTSGYVDGAGGVARFNSPSGIAVSPSGTVYVSDTNNLVIRAITPGGLVSTFAGGSTNTLGSGFADGAGTSVAFASVGYLAVTSSGILLVIDTYGAASVIRAIDPATARVSTLLGASYSKTSRASWYTNALPFEMVMQDSNNWPFPLGSSPFLFPNNYGPLGALAVSPGGLISVSFSDPSYYSSYSAGFGNIFFVTCSPLPPGAPCDFTDTCASGSCRGGVCCSADAATLGCSLCAASTGSCALSSPGETCGSSFDCGTNLCLGGCCCASSAITNPSCTTCTCLSAPTTTAQTAGACSSSTTPPLSSITCNASTTAAVNASVFSQLITFPAATNISSARPLLVLSSASPLNSYGVDIVIATRDACTAWAALHSGVSCNWSISFAHEGASYYYVGTASALHMTASSACD